MRIMVVAPSCSLSPDVAGRVAEITAARGDCELIVHPQCFAQDGHFAGSDAVRLAAVREALTDDGVDAVWLVRGGYGSNRIAEDAARDLPKAARRKVILGYSDGGFLLAALHNAGMQVAHGPMVQDVLRGGGEAAIGRALDWLVRGETASLEGGLNGPAFAFNLVVLSSLMGTPLEPDFTGAELLLEEVDEEHYRIDRFLFHVTSQPGLRTLHQLRLGRCTTRPNDRPFGGDEEAIARGWCERAGIVWGGRADIGHDASNRVVPFPLRSA